MCPRRILAKKQHTVKQKNAGRAKLKRDLRNFRRKRPVQVLQNHDKAV